jgi:hypothetical protein
MHRLSAASPRPLPVCLHLRPKRRWWPLFAGFWAAGVCALALFGSSQQPEGTASQGKPLSHLFVTANELTPANRPVKPAVARGLSESAHAPEVLAVPDIAGDDPLVANIKTSSATKTKMPVAAPARTTTHAVHVAAPARTGAYAMHVATKHSKPVRRYAAKKSHPQVVANDWRYGGYSWGRYGFNGNSHYGGWFFN